MLNTSVASLAGRKLYHDIWNDVRLHFYDQKALSNWSEWEHKFDEEILDGNSARQCIALMLGSLSDRYTRLLSIDEAEHELWFDAAQDLEDAQDKKVLARSEDLGDSIGYLEITGFKAGLIEQLDQAIEEIAHLDAVIVDLMCNTGGGTDLAVNCLERFHHTGSVINVEFSNEDGFQHRKVWFEADSFEVKITMASGEEQRKSYIRKPGLLANKPIVILIDGNTMSAAELVALSLLKNKGERSVTTCGTKSHGKGYGHNLFTYPDGTAIRLSCLRFFAEDGTWIGDCGRTVSNGLEPDLPATTWKEAVNIAFHHLRDKLKLREP